MPITPVTSTAESAAAAASTRLTDSFDNFLTLLTAQLQNQDPLEPLKTHEFTSQLVQFTNVEQQIAANANLEKLIGLTETVQLSAALDTLGKTIEAPGDSATLASGEATWRYSLATTAGSVSIEVFDENGKRVATEIGETDSGAHTFVWDGLSDQGVPQPDGTYTIKITATNGDGQAVTATTSIVDTVTGIETIEGVQTLLVGGLQVPLKSVTSVTLPATEEI